MMSKSRNYLGCVATAVFFVASCGSKTSDPIDVQNPVIEVVSINTSPTTDTICGDIYNDVLHYLPGDTIKLNLEIRDDIKLSQLKLEIHENADCHGHGERPGAEFHYTRIVDLMGKEVEHSEVIPIPADADTIPYHFNMKAIDAAGKESNEIEYNLRLIP